MSAGRAQHSRLFEAQVEYQEITEQTIKMLPGRTEG
jgi:hypothetical protein